MTQKTKMAERTTTAQTAKAPSKGAVKKNNKSNKKSQEPNYMGACGWAYGCIVHGLFEKVMTPEETIKKILKGFVDQGVL